MKYVVDDKKLNAATFIAFVNQERDFRLHRALATASCLFGRFICLIICYKEVICSGDKRCHT